MLIEKIRDVTESKIVYATEICLHKLNVKTDIISDYIHDKISLAKMFRTNYLKFEVSLHWPFCQSFPDRCV